MVSIPLRKFRKWPQAGYLRQRNRVSIPLRKFRKENNDPIGGNENDVSIPLRKFRKDRLRAEEREAE